MVAERANTSVTCDGYLLRSKRVQGIAQEGDGEHSAFSAQPDTAGIRSSEDWSPHRNSGAGAVTASTGSVNLDWCGSTKVGGRFRLRLASREGTDAGFIGTHPFAKNAKGWGTPLHR